MISKKDITKIAKRIIRRQRGLRDHQMIHPRREWSVGLVSGFVLLLGGAVWSFLTYGEVSERDVQNVGAVEVQQTVYREEMVEAALEQFRQKKSDYQELLVASETNNPDIEEVEVIIDPIEAFTEEEVPEEEGLEQEVIETDETEVSETTEVAPETEEVNVEPVEIEEPQSIGPPTTPPDLQPGF